MTHWLANSVPFLLPNCSLPNFQTTHHLKHLVPYFGLFWRKAEIKYKLCYGMNCMLPKMCRIPVKCLYLEIGPCRGNQVKIKSLRWALVHYIFLLRRGKMSKWRQTHREMATWSERQRLKWDKEHQGWTATTRSQEEARRVLPTGFRDTWPCWPLRL